MSQSYCMQCGVSGTPAPAVGKDADGEPACACHVNKPDSNYETFGNEHLCACGCGTKLYGKRMYKWGHTPQKSGRKPETIVHNQQPKPRAEVTTRRLREADVEAVFPTVDSFVGDSIIRVKLRGGEIAIMYKGDTLSLLADAEDLRFVRSLVITAQRYGQAVTFLNPHAKRTGKYFDIKMDEGFVDDMISMLEPADKAKLLNYLYTKQDDAS